MTIVHINKESFPNSKLYPNKKVFLSIKEPGTYILDEDIIVGSSSAGDDGNYLDFDRQVGPPPFHFGVWAVIAIECNDVILDLNGYKLAMTNNFAMQQRFFSLIELANQPFPTGKAGFTNEIKIANNVTIKNGTLINSSHHGIHGNFNKNIYLEDLVIKDFEVAGIAINTGYNINIKDTKIDGTSNKIKVIATFAMVQDLKDSLKQILHMKKHEKYHELANKYLSHEYLQHILDNAGTDDYDITVNQPVENGSQVLDGNLFGIYFNNVFSVGELSTCGKKSEKINIENVTIKDINSNIHEVIGISGNGVCIKDNKGYLIRWDYIFSVNGNPLKINSEKRKAQLFLVKLQLFCLKILKDQDTILNEIIDYNNLDLEFINDNKINVDPIGGFDSRAHAAKGNFGLRIDGASDIKINNLHIHNIENYGDKARKTEKTVYSKIPIGIGNEETKVYKGNSVSGLSLSYCDNVEITNSKICKCKSKNGFVIGAGLLNNTNECKINKLGICKLEIEGKHKSEYPNIEPKVYPIYIDPTSYNNQVLLNQKKEIIDQDKNNKLGYYCSKCDKKHLI